MKAVNNLLLFAYDLMEEFSLNMAVFWKKSGVSAKTHLMKISRQKLDSDSLIIEEDVLWSGRFWYSC